MKILRIVFVFAAALTLPLVAAQKSTTTTTKNAGDPAQRLAALKANFPAKRVEKVGVIHGSRNDVIQVDVPHADMWANYRGMVQTATLASASATLARIEKAIESDTAKLQEQAKVRSNQSGAEQAKQSLRWLNSTLRPYLAQLRVISEGR